MYVRGHLSGLTSAEILSAVCSLTPASDMKVVISLLSVKDIVYNEVQRLHFKHMKELMEDVCAGLDEPITPVVPTN